MELVEGRPLSEVVTRGGLKLDRLLTIAAQIAGAVAAAHKHGIVHRDLKPANVMVGPQDRVKVLDFGLAKLRAELAGEGETLLQTKDITGQGRILGTASYMSPEQAEGRSIDNRSDVFSLGVVLYEMATGERPFKGDTSMSVLSAAARRLARPSSSCRTAVVLLPRVRDDLSSLTSHHRESRNWCRYLGRASASAGSVRMGRSCISCTAARPETSGWCGVTTA